MTFAAQLSMCLDSLPCDKEAALYPTSGLPQPAYAHKQQIQGVASWQNGTRCRGDVKVLWCPSHLDR